MRSACAVLYWHLWRFESMWSKGRTDGQRVVMKLMSLFAILRMLHKNKGLFSLLVILVTSKVSDIELKQQKIWIKRDQLDVTCFIISLFNAQHVSDVNTSILRSLRLNCWVVSWVVLFWFRIRIPRQPSQTTIQHQHTSNQSNTTHEITQQISRKRLRMDVLTSETCWALNNEIIKQVTSSWSLFIQLSRWCTVQ